MILSAGTAVKRSSRWYPEGEHDSHLLDASETFLQ